VGSGRIVSIVLLIAVVGIAWWIAHDANSCHSED
jgi:hypothetical protein